MGGSGSNWENKSENHPKIVLMIVLIHWDSKYIMCILYVLLKVVSHYDLSVLFMSGMGFQKNVDRVVF